MYVQANQPNYWTEMFLFHQIHESVPAKSKTFSPIVGIIVKCFNYDSYSPCGSLQYTRFHIVLDMYAIYAMQCGLYVRPTSRDYRNKLNSDFYFFSICKQNIDVSNS